MINVAACEWGDFNRSTKPKITKPRKSTTFSDLGDINEINKRPQLNTNKAYLRNRKSVIIMIIGGLKGAPPRGGTNGRESGHFHVKKGDTLRLSHTEGDTPRSAGKGDTPHR